MQVKKIKLLRQIYICILYAMAQTRFFDDPARIAAALELQTQLGRYVLNTPGWGEDLPYLEDVQMRLQRWGANLDQNSLQIEDDLRGMNRPLVSKDAFVHVYEPMDKSMADAAGATFAARYRTENPTIDETRATHPAWVYRSVEDKRTFEVPPFLNPQAERATEIGFPWNIQTRILEKDAYETRSGASGVGAPQAPPRM